MNSKSLLPIALLLCAHCALAQRVKFGLSAGVVRSFVYPQAFSTKGRYDYAHAEGQLGYMLNLRAEKALAAKTALDLGLRFLSTSTYYDVDLVAVDPVASNASFGITHTWRANRRNYRLYTGLSHALLDA